MGQAALQAAGPEQGEHGIALIVVMLDQQKASGGKGDWRPSGDGSQGIQAIEAAIESQPGLVVPHRGLQGRQN